MSHKKDARRIRVNITVYNVCAFFIEYRACYVGQIFVGMVHSFPGITHVAEARRCGYVHKMKPTG